MELRVLRYFIEVARTQNITAAAERLHITQPTLSKQLMDLEDELGTKLFERGKRRTTLTEDGMLLFQRAKEIVALADLTESAFRSTDERIAGDIAIGCGETNGMRLLVDAMKEMRAAHPGVTFRLSSGNFEDISDRLDGGLVDFGLFVGDAAVAKYDYIKLPHSDAWGLLMRADDALAERAAVRTQDLDGLALLCSRQAVQSNELAGWLGREFGELDIVATYNLIHNATYMVEAGMGCAVSIEGLVNTSGTGLVFRPFEPALTARLSFAWKRGRQLSRAAAEFLKLLQSKIG